MSCVGRPSLIFGLFPSSSLDRLSFIWSLSSAGKTALVEDEQLDLMLFMEELFREFPFASLCPLQSFLMALKLLLFWRRPLDKPAQDTP